MPWMPRSRSLGSAHNKRLPFLSNVSRRDRVWDAMYGGIRRRQHEVKLRSDLVFVGGIGMPLYAMPSCSENDVKRSWIMIILTMALVSSLLSACSKPPPRATDSYWLCVANTESTPAEITENVTGQRFKINANEDKTFKVERQPNDKRGAEREFTIACGGKSKTMREKVTKGRTILLSVGEPACFLCVDYSRRYFTEQELEVRKSQGYQYVPKEPEQELKVIHVFKNQEIYPEDEEILARLGEPLPDKLRVKSVDNRSTGPVLRLLRVPCDVVSSRKRVYEYLRGYMN